MLGVTPTSTRDWLLVDAAHTGTTLDLLGTIGTALAVLGVAVLLTARGAGLLLPLACAGSMTLTIYSLHVLALAQGSPFLSSDRRELWLAHVVVALVVATAWRVALGRGPLEWVSAVFSRGVALAAVPEPAVPVSRRRA